jgi:pimeloyl-ACP methyl ester carboxylesterase
MTPPATTGRIEVLNGQPLYFEVRGTGDPLLLLHGFTGCSQNWLPTMEQWGSGFQLIVPDLRGHGRSGVLRKPFRHEDAAIDMLALLNHLGIESCRGVGVSAGGNVLLHMAARQPKRVNAMILVSATPYFPEQARQIMSAYGDPLPEQVWEMLRQQHPGGDEQIKMLIASTKAFATSYDDMNFDPQRLAGIQARTFITQGDSDPLYPVQISIEMAKAIPKSKLWIIPGGGHAPVFGERWPEFIRVASAFLEGPRG